MRKNFLAAIASLSLALPASADPTLSVSTSSIAESPTQTTITFSVNPNGTPVSALVLNFSALATGLEIVAIASLDGAIFTSGPALSGGDWIASFGTLGFIPDRMTSFDVGTLTLEGLVSGTPLVVSGNFTDGSFVDYPVGPSSVAVVTPEPGSAALLALGIALIGFRRRERPAA